MKQIILIGAALMMLFAGGLLAQSAGEEFAAFAALLAQAPPAPPAPPVPPVRAFVQAFVGGSYLGIGIHDVNAERAKALKLAEERGVEITRVEEDSPASKAGLKKGDVVLEYNGQRVEGTEQFVRLVRETPAGRQVKLLVTREGATQTITATVGERKGKTFRWEGEWQRDLEKQMEKLQENLKRFREREFEVRMRAIPSPMMSWRAGLLGIEAESLKSQLAEYFGVKEGVLVRQVSKDSAAEKAGIKAGDVITKVDGEKVSTPGEVTGALRTALPKKKTVPVAVVRNRQEMTLNVTIEEAERLEPSPRPRVIREPREPRSPAPPAVKVKAPESIPL